MAEERALNLRKSWKLVQLHYPYFKDGEHESIYEDVKQFFTDLSLYFNTYSSHSLADVLPGARNTKHFTITLALLIMALLQSQVDTRDDRKKASAQASKVLWDEWGASHFTYYTNAEYSFDEYGHLETPRDTLLQLLYGKFVNEHSTLLQKMAGEFYRYLYENVGEFRKVTDRLVAEERLKDNAFHFPLI